MNRYEEALAAFLSGDGCRWNENLGGTLAGIAVKMGKTAEEVSEDIADQNLKLAREQFCNIRRSMANAERNGITLGSSRYSRPKPQKVRFTGDTSLVRKCITAGGNAEPTADFFAGLSPFSVKALSPEEQTMVWMMTAWKESDILFVATKGERINGYPDINLKPCAKWVESVSCGEPLVGDIVSVCPLTGTPHQRDASWRSFVDTECIAAYPYLVAELDDLPASAQAAFWTGALQFPYIRKRLVSLVTSGKRSLHALLRTDAATRAEYDAFANSILSWFAVDPNTETRTEDGKEKLVYPYRIDRAAAINPLTKTRIAGAHRFDNGAIQRLLYLNPDAAYR